MIYIVLTTSVILEGLIVTLGSIGLMVIAFFIINKIETYLTVWKYEKHLHRQEKIYEEYLQQKRKRELNRKEREKYPLFYWKENERLRWKVEHPWNLAKGGLE